MKSAVLIFVLLVGWVGPLMAQPAPPTAEPEESPRAFYARYLLREFARVDPQARSSALRPARAALEKQPPELEECVRRLEAAAQGNDPAAQFLMGYVKENELPFEGQVEIRGDLVAAAEWYEKAAAQKVVRAMEKLGEFYYYGSLGTNDILAAARWWEQAANAGSVSAMRQLGQLYQRYTPALGTQVAPQYKLAVQWYLRAAEKGDAESMFQLARHYHFGAGTEKNEAQSRLWLGQAARAGNVKADQVLGGTLGLDGEGLTAGQHAGEGRNSSGSTPAQKAQLAQLSEDELLMAINSGSQEAHLRLGEKYERGAGIPVDLEKALEQYSQVAGLMESVRPKWLTAAANEGIVRIYASGKLKREPLEAVVGISDPNQLPSAESRFQLAELYWNGNQAIKANPTNAVIWYLHAARAGSAPAMRRLGELWRDGVNGTPDPAEAERWFQRAERLSNRQP